MILVFNIRVVKVLRMMKAAEVLFRENSVHAD